MKACLAIFLILFLFSRNLTAAEIKDVWIDADPACGLGKMKDVDDCWAIIAAIRSSHLNIIGLSTVFGNIDLSYATKTSNRLLSKIRELEPGKVLPSVFTGAIGPISESQPLPQAVTSLEAALVKRPMTLIALGPLTNIAMLLEKRPDLINRINGIIAVGGQRPGQVFKVGNTPILHFHDLNVRKDVDAFDIVLQSEIPMHLFPFEVGIQVVVTRSDLKTLELNGNLDHWIGQRSMGWLDFWENTLGAEGFSPFDTLTIAYLAAPHLFSCEAQSAKIVRRKGIFTTRDTLEITPLLAGGRMVSYCSQVSAKMKKAIADFVSNPDSINSL